MPINLDIIQKMVEWHFSGNSTEMGYPIYYWFIQWPIRKL